MSTRPSRRHPRRTAIVKNLRMELKSTGEIRVREMARKHKVSHVTIRDWIREEKILDKGISEKELSEAAKRFGKLLRQFSAEGNPVSPKLRNELEKLVLSFGDLAYR